MAHTQLGARVCVYINIHKYICMSTYRIGQRTRLRNGLRLWQHSSSSTSSGETAARFSTIQQSNPRREAVTPIPNPTSGTRTTHTHTPAHALPLALLPSRRQRVRAAETEGGSQPMGGCSTKGQVERKNRSLKIDASMPYAVGTPSGWLRLPFASAFDFRRSALGLMISTAAALLHPAPGP